MVADTNRFNQDTGLPPVQNQLDDHSRLPNARRHLKIYRLGIPVEWIEEPFEWVRPYRYGVIRNYSRGPVRQMRVQVDLKEKPDHGTELSYKVWAQPGWTLLGHLAIPFQIGWLSAVRFRKIFHAYDDAISAGKFLVHQARNSYLSQSGKKRLRTIQKELTRENSKGRILHNLTDLIEYADDLTLTSLRPYIFADQWKSPRKETLEVFLEASRLGLLDFRWHLLCPLCRVDRKTSNSLKEIDSTVHCDTCNVDFDTNFEHSVELTFRPNPAIREVPEGTNFCVGGPEVTPHVVVQQLMKSGEKRTIRPDLEEGRYRIRVLEQRGNQNFQVTSEGMTSVDCKFINSGWQEDRELRISQETEFLLTNDSDDDHLFILERIAWTDQSVTAAEVIALQRFRDLFANEVIRPGQEISVGSMAILFTDIRGSTRLYREIGDATAFGIVMDHFDVLKACIDRHNGALIKTIGDAIMGVFTHPGDGLSAILEAQRILSQPQSGNRPLFIKAGIHYGPCIVVNQNERLDYFGSTVNLAARLEGLSKGDDIIISDSVFRDPDVITLLDENPIKTQAVGFQSGLKGFEGESFELWRIESPDKNI